MPKPEHVAALAQLVTHALVASPQIREHLTTIIAARLVEPKWREVGT